MVEAVGEQDRKDNPRVDAVTTLGRLPGLARTDNATQTDSDLIRGAQANDHAAFETLVRRYAERAFRAAYRVVRDQQAAEEVLQEALIKAYRALPRFEARSSFYTWLYRITVNLALEPITLGFPERVVLVRAQPLVEVAALQITSSGSTPRSARNTIIFLRA